MFQDVLRHMPDASWYPQVGLVIFAVVFIGVTLRVILTPRREIKRWAELPLDEKR